MTEKPSYEDLEKRILEMEQAVLESKALEQEQFMTLELLELINQTESLKDLLENIIERLRDWSGCEAVAIRLREGSDYPYFVTSGFPDHFVDLERHLCMYDQNGKVLRDDDGRPILECMCGNILQERYDPAKNFFTLDGSFWSNCTTELLATTTETDRQVRTRNRCNSSGYESVALVPLRSAGETFGLIQFNDHQKNRFTPELIARYRRFADYIAGFLAKREARESLRKSEMNLRTLIDTLPDLVWLKDTEGVYLACNHRFERFFGAKEAEIVGRTDYDFLSKKQADFFREKDREAMAAGKPCVNEEEIVFADDGHHEILETIKTPVYDPEGKINSVLGISRNITPRVEAESILKESEERLSLALEVSQAGVYDHNVPIKKGTYHSERWANILGYDREEFPEVDSFLGWLEKITHPEDYPRMIRAYSDFIEGLTPNYNVEVRMKHKSGDWIWVQNLSKAVEKGKDGKILRVVGLVSDITKRKRVESEMINLSEQRQLALDAADLGWWRYNPITGLLSYDRRYSEIFGFSGSEKSNDEILNILHPADLPGVMVAVEAALNPDSPAPFAVEYRINRQDGEERWVEAHGLAVFEGDAENCRAKSFVGTVKDITESKALADALRESEEHYRDLVQNVNSAVIRLKSDGTIIFFNQFALDFFGYTSDEITGKSIGILIPQTDADGLDLSGILQGVLENPETHVSMVTENIRKDGSRVWMTWTNKTIFDQQGNVKEILSVGNDITDLRKAERALLENEKKLRLFIEHAPVSLAMFDRDMRYLAVSTRWMKYYGLGEINVIGKSHYEIFPEISDSWKSVHRRGMAGEVIKKDEDRFKRQSGEEQWLRWEVHPWLTADNAVGGILIFTEDISRSKTIEDEKEKLQTQLLHAQKMEAIGTLTGGISHDFNNLLQVINGYTQLLLLEKSKGDPEYDALKTVHDAGHRASELVRHLLLFSRKADAAKMSVELPHEVEHAKKMLERTIPKMVELQVVVGDRLWPILADPIQIEQMLLNLGTNAADAMPDGGKLVFRIENIILDENYSRRHLDVKPGRYVLISVSDTGHGIDKETLKKIFDPFYTTKEFGKGTGLGLASVYGIVKSHGGYINCYSEIGQGTTFRIYMPALEQPKDEENKEDQPKPLPRGTETILLVDDEEQIRGFAQQALMKFGYKVMTASSGEEALQLYANQREIIDLVVMDLGMPGMGGHKCLQEMLKINPAIKVIIASGYSINGKIKKSIEAGAAGSIRKPYLLADLLNTVRAVLDNQER